MNRLGTGSLIPFIFLFFSATLACAQEDHRAWQHGVELLKLNGKNILIWGSWDNPPVASPGQDWKHDIYYASMDSCGKITPPSLLVGGHEAQEPPSAAVNSHGKILITWEDGSDGINQYATFWNARDRKPDKKFLIRDGGHSGHVAASQDRFLVAYSEDWVDADDGFLGRGTGKNLLARIVEDNGRVGPEINISPGNSAKREDWPLVAGSASGWMIVWQRYPRRTLHAVVVSRAGAVLPQTLIAKDLRVGYHYDVQYIPALDAYFILAATTNSGVAVLIDAQGKILARNDKLPPIVSESRFVWTTGPSGIIGIYPLIPSGVALVHVTAKKITLQETLTADFQWDYIGTVGTFVSPSKAVFATLSKNGLKTATFNLAESSLVPHSADCALE